MLGVDAWFGWVASLKWHFFCLFWTIDHPSDRLGGRFNSIIDVIRVDAIRTI